MTRQLMLATVVALAAGSAGAQSLYVSPDVPTDPDGPATYLPWEVVRNEPSAAPYTLEYGIPARTAVDALHKMDLPGSWLFSLEVPSDLAGALPVDAEPRDVVRDTGGVFGIFFDGSCVAPALPPSVSIDALYLDGGDTGDLVTSFDVPLEILGVTVAPSALGRWSRVGIGPCGWSWVGVEIDLAFATYFPVSANVTGADREGPDYLLTLDVPTDVGPPFQTILPGQVVATDGVTWSVFRDLGTSGAPGWPISSEIDALACEANPGRIKSPTTHITMSKSGPTATIHCPGSCASGGRDYGVYEGDLLTLFMTGVYDHKAASCANVCPGAISFPVAGGATYYLVVPHNGKEEGSYGVDSGGIERPQAAAPADRCVVPQNLTACP